MMCFIDKGIQTVAHLSSNKTHHILKRPWCLHFFLRK